MTVYSVEFKHTKAIPHTNLGSSRQVFVNERSASNNWAYKFFVDVDGSLKYQWKNGSDVWSSSIDVHTTGQVTAFDVKVHDTGILLDVYVVLIDWTNLDLTYRKGTIADGSDTISFSSAQDIDTALNSDDLELFGCAIARTANSELVVGWAEATTSTVNIRIIGSNGVGASPTWSQETIAFAEGTTSHNIVVAVGLESFDSSFGDRFVIYSTENAAPDDVYVEVFDWIEGTGFTSIASDFLDLTTGNEFAGASASIDSNDKVHVAFIDGNLVKHVRYPTAGALGTETATTVTTLTAPEFPESVSLSIDHTGDEVYIFYKKHSETADFYYKKSDVGTTSFGSETTLTIAEDIDYISTSQRDQDGKMTIVSSPEV